ncbi:MAG: dTDP-4-dehydrorhamnose reductase [Gammaproteobacteria bacterium]|nr:dTDP-4-dehydrorhamnose reductase [Gammaproteobacteria bacterium]
MSRPRILITGGQGQVGFELVRSFGLVGEVLAPSRAELDLADTTAVKAWLAEHRPDWILNPAAFTAVDKAESERDICWRVNAELPQLLAEYAVTHNAGLIHFSSDYVYPGDGDCPRAEDAPTAPVNYYGRSKLAGDEAVLRICAETTVPYYILRTSWVYSARGHNFLRTMLRLGRERSQLNVVADQVGAPTSARCLAQLALLMFARRPESGLYHAVSRGEVSWQGFAQSIFRQAHALGCTLTIEPEQVAGIATRDYPTPAQRPLNSRLAVAKIEQALAVQLPQWETELQQVLMEWHSTQLCITAQGCV